MIDSTGIDSTEQRERALDLLARFDADVLMACDPSNVTWLTGFVRDCQTGPSPFAPAPDIAILTREGELTLLACSDSSFQGSYPSITVVKYPGYQSGIADPRETFEKHVTSVLPKGARFLTEHLFVPIIVSPLLGDAQVIDVSKDLAMARAIKTPDEVLLIQSAVALANYGHEVACQTASRGMTELELFGTIRGAMESRAGERLPLWADCLSGERCGEVEGPPTSREMSDGDMLITDLLPRWKGYWGDTASTCIVGTESQSLDRMIDTVRDAVLFAASMVKPGLIAQHLDRDVRHFVKQQGFAYPHHTGHGIGTAYYEEPQLAPRSTVRLEEGMVLTVEPGAYTDSKGCRIEVALRVTESGCRLLSPHPLVSSL